MAVTFVSSAVGTGNPTTSVSITIPTVAVDDLLIASFTNGGATTAPTVTDNDTGTPDTWHKKTAGTTKGTVWYKRATSATSAKVVTAAGMTNSSSATLFVLRGAITSGDPFDQFTEEENIAGDETHAGVTTTVDGCYVGFCIANGATNGDSAGVASVAGATIGSLSDFVNDVSTGGVDCANSQAGVEQASAGPTGDITWAQANLATTSSLYAVKPPASVDYSVTGGVTPGALPIAGSTVAPSYGTGPGAHVAASLPIVGATVVPVYAKTISVTPASLPIVGATVVPVHQGAQTDYDIEVTPGALPIAGATVNTVLNKSITVTPASLPIAGGSVVPLLARSVSITPATLPIAGATVETVLARSVTIEPASLPIQGATVEPVFTGSLAYTIEVTPASLPFAGATVELAYVAGPGEGATGGASYIPGLVEGYRARRERRRKAEERLWETARETYRQLHGIAREAPEALPEAIQEEIKELVAPAVKARAAKRAQATLPAPSTINWTAVAAHLDSVERLTVILEQIERDRQEDEDDDEDFLFMAA
jgi:hypothetical protein